MGSSLDVFKKIDRFGVSFSLNHEDSFEFHTITGGLFSMFLYIVVGYTIVILMIRMANRHDINVEVTNTDNELIFSNETVRPFENNKFMMALTVELFGKNESKSWFYDNVNVKFQSFTAVYNEDISNYDISREDMNVSRCSDTDFPAKAYEASPHVYNLYWLPTDIELSGGNMGRSFKYFNIILSYSPTSVWDSYQEFLDGVDEIYVKFLVAHEVLNPNNFDDPIGTVIDDQYAISMTPSSLSYYHFSIQKNQYEVDNGYIVSNIKTGNLYQVAGTSSSVLDSDTERFFVSTLKLSSNSKIYKSQVYQFLDALGTIGGVFELCFGFLFLIYSFVSRKLYYFHMINGLKTVENQDKLSEDKEMRNMQYQRHDDADEPIEEHMPRRFDRGDRYAYASMVREMNNQIHTAQTKQRRKLQKIIYQTSYSFPTLLKSIWCTWSKKLNDLEYSNYWEDIQKF